MAKVKKKWNAWIKFAVTGYPAVEFNGRDPVLVENDSLRAILLRQGVFTELPGKMLRYSASAKLRNVDGTICPVDQNGIVEYDSDFLVEKYRYKIDADMKDYTREEQDKIDVLNAAIAQEIADKEAAQKDLADAKIPTE